MPEWLKGADCKSVAFCYVGSNPTRPNTCYAYKAVMLLIIINRSINDTKIKDNKINLNFFILNKFRKGAKIIKINPAKLLIKKRGYRDTLFQKSFIIMLK